MSLNTKINHFQMPVPTAVLFDLDNTLYPYKTSHLKAMLAVEQKVSKLFGIHKREFHEALEKSRFEIHGRLGPTASSHNRLLYFQRAIELLGMKTQVLAAMDLEQIYWRTFLLNSRLFPGVKEFIDDVKSFGIKTAVVTDLTVQVQFRKLVYFGLQDSFDYIVTSEESGIEKPAAVPFHLAIKKLTISHGDPVWFIGDHPEKDIQGAHNALNAITFQKRHEDVEIQEYRDCPSVIFDNYEELRNFITRLARVPHQSWNTEPL